jgi:hypothetical protein
MSGLEALTSSILGIYRGWCFIRYDEIYTIAFFQTQNIPSKCLSEQHIEDLSFSNELMSFLIVLSFFLSSFSKVWELST